MDSAGERALYNASVERAALLENYAAVFAHEVRNPLNALAMNTQVARMLLADGRADDAMKVLERVERDVRRCADAVRELAALAAREGPVERVSLAELLAKTSERLRSAAPALEVVIDGAEAALACTGHRAALDFALDQVARSMIARGVPGLRFSVTHAPGGCVLEIERLEGEPRATDKLSPTRIAAWAVARHALEVAGATLQPATLEAIPRHCVITFAPETIQRIDGSV